MPPHPPAPVAVAIMAKVPRPGEVKTRLCPPLTAEQAAELYRCFLADKITQVRTLRGARPVIAFSPDDARPTFQALAPGFELVPQRGPDLGSRLLNILQAFLGDETPAALAIDSDTPTLPTEFLQDGVDRLAGGDVDVVLGPTEDGGYYLIGVRRPHPELFHGIAWSTASVLHDTLVRAQAAGLATVCLTPWFDVDTPADLERLRTTLAGRSSGVADHTARFLAGRR